MKGKPKLCCPLRHEEKWNSRNLFISSLHESWSFENGSLLWFSSFKAKVLVSLPPPHTRDAIDTLSVVTEQAYQHNSINQHWYSTEFRMTVSEPPNYFSLTFSLTLSRSLTLSCFLPTLSHYLSLSLALSLSLFLSLSTGWVEKETYY